MGKGKYEIKFRKTVKKTKQSALIFKTNFIEQPVSRNLWRDADRAGKKPKNKQRIVVHKFRAIKF